MPRLRSVKHVLRRTQEVGVRGVRRRVLAHLSESSRARARSRWRERFGGDGAAQQLGIELAGSSIEDARKAVGEAPFFFDARDPALRASFLGRCGAAAPALLAQADAALAGDLGFVVPGGVPDWHAVLPGGGRWPLVEPDATGYGDADPPGDVRLTWEIGRCPHLVRLAQAAWLTGDARYVRGVVSGLRSWIDENPVGLGIGWAHAQEAALRAVAFLWCLRLIGERSELDDETFERILVSLLAHGAYVESHLADHVLTHNHLVSELGGLVALGTALPMLRSAAGWRSSGLRLLEREIRKQVDAEGAQGEQSIHYHAFVLDTCVAALRLADQGGAPLAAPVRARIEKMAELVALLLGPDGRLPPVGDTDAGRAWRLGVDPLDRRDVLAASAVTFARGDLAAISGDAPGAFFLTGGAPLPPVAAPRPGLLARRLGAAGLGVARTGFGPEDELVLFRAGATRFLADVQTAHAHADALSVTWRIGARPVLVDPGVYVYSEGAGWRYALRKSRAHSTVVIDDLDQADVTSARFGVLDLAPSRWYGFEGGPTGLRAEAVHPATGKIRVRRRVAWLPHGLLAICDDVLGSGVHEVSVWFQLPASTGEVDGTGVDLLLEGGPALRMDVFAEVAEISLHRPGEAGAPGPGWYCPRYGERRPGTALRISTGRRALPVTIVTLLRATEGATRHDAASVEKSAKGLALRAGSRSFVFPRAGGIREGRSA